MKEEIKQNLLYCMSYFLSNSKVQPIPEYTVCCKKDEVKYYASTPNTIIYFNKDGHEGFFRECRKHTSKREYLNELLDEYCKYVYVNEHSRECRQVLNEKLSDKASFERFFNMGAGTASYTRITKFRRTHDASVIGIHKPYPEWFENQLLMLVQYAWGALEEYKYNAFLDYGMYHTYNSNRTYCTKLVADLIGASELVPPTQYARMILDGVEKYGVVVGVAAGCSPEEAVKQHGMNKVSPEFQRQSLILNILDVICYQKDHRPGNYFVTVKDNIAVNISAFDNDCPTTLMCTKSIRFRTYMGCDPIVTEEGMIARPYLDKENTEKLIKLNAESITHVMSGNLSKVELRYLIKRIKALQESIKRSLNSGKLILLDETQWDENTVSLELNGGYGKTYLSLFLEKCFSNKK